MIERLCQCRFNIFVNELKYQIWLQCSDTINVTFWGRLWIPYCVPFVCLSLSKDVRQHCHIYIYIDPHWCQFNRLELPFWFAFHALIVLLHVVRLYIGRLATTILFVLDRTCVSVYWYAQYIVHITDWMGITDLHNTECNPHIYATLC